MLLLWRYGWLFIRTQLKSLDMAHVPPSMQGYTLYVNHKSECLEE